MILPILFHVAMAADSPARQALGIAQASPQVTRLYAELKREAGKIHDARLKKDALEILETPRFSVVDGRKADADEIEKNLRSAGLLSDAAHVFPPNAPMPFLATPGSPWRGHHSYPGGLLRHELVNLKTALAAGATYRDVYGIKLNEDWLRAAPIWHDSAKTITVAWNADGTTNADEGQIAGTGTHHILAVAEAVYRGYDPAFVVTLASAHAPPTPGAGLESLVKFLHAAAIIAGKPLSAAGLSDDGARLAADPPIEAFVHHLSDHDWVMTEVSQTKAVDARGDLGGTWAADAFFARYGEVYVYAQWLKGGPSAVHALSAPQAK